MMLCAEPFKKYIYILFYSRKHYICTSPSPENMGEYPDRKIIAKNPPIKKEKKETTMSCSPEWTSTNPNFHLSQGKIKMATARFSA